MYKENKILGVSILGGTGFIGRHLVDYFLNQGVESIRILTRKKGLINNVSFVQGDLISSNSLNELVNGQELLINLAYISENHKANLIAIDQLANACIEEGVSKFIHCSTAVVAGRVDVPLINEETLCNPLSGYEKTKLAIEDLLLSRFRDKVELIIVRPTAVFGEGGQNLVKTANALMNKSRIANILPILINRDRKMHLVPVEEVVRGIYYLATIDQDLSGEKFIISQDSHPYNNYFNILNHLATKFGHKSYPAIFIPFSSLFLMLILKLMGRSQVNPNQVFSSKKLHEYGYSSNVDFIESVDKFALSLYS